jgi:hypothetical protein
MILSDTQADTSDRLPPSNPLLRALQELPHPARGRNIRPSTSTELVMRQGFQ